MTNSDIIKGKMKHTEGKIESKFGDIVDSPEHEVRGIVKQVEGKIQEGYGKTRQAAVNAINNSRRR